MATISKNNIARAIYTASLNKTEAEQDIFLKNVVNFLFRHKLISQSKDILIALRKMVHKEQGFIEARIWSKNKITEKNKTELIQILKKRYGGKNFILEEKLDDKLLGGFKIEVNNELIDLTLKNKINKLQEHLIRSYE